MVEVSVGEFRWVHYSDFEIFLGKRGCFAKSGAIHSQVGGSAGCVMWEQISMLILRNFLGRGRIGEPSCSPESLVGEH
jgi:hypothetical protein